MKLWSGVVTEHLQACRDFYVRLFQCRVLFDSDWFVLLELGGGDSLSHAAALAAVSVPAPALPAFPE